MKFSARAVNGELVFSSRAKQALVEKFNGEWFKVTLDNRESDKMRRFFEGAVVKYWFYQNPKSGWETFENARNSLKLEHNFTFVNDRSGAPQKIEKSSAMSSVAFTEFLGRIERDFTENGFEFPDAEAYRAWEDSAPDRGVEYPPLKKLIARYNLEKI